jgi:hypothetical protein
VDRMMVDRMMVDRMMVDRMMVTSDGGWKTYINDGSRRIN